jgi:ABC-type branched-subunit amino acid transport system ATPase component
VLIADSVRKSFGSVVALDHLNLEIASGETTCLLGANGAGTLKQLHDTIGPATVSRVRLSLAEAEAIPEFEFQAPAIPTSVWLWPAWVALLGAAGLLWSLGPERNLC